MQATNDLRVVKQYSILSLIAVAILDDGVEELAKYMAEAGYADERAQVKTILSVAVNDDEPTLVVRFMYLASDGETYESGAFFIWIKEDESIDGDF